MLDKAIDSIRIVLYVLAVFVALMLYEAWQNDHPAPVATETQSAVSSDRYVPTAAKAEPAAAAVQSADASAMTPPSQTGKLITVKTDVMNITIDTQGGDIVGSSLIQYPETLGAS